MMNQAIREQRKAFKEKEKVEMSYVSHLLGTSGEQLQLEGIKEQAKVITSQLLSKKAEKRRKQNKGANEILSSSSEEEDTYFRGKQDLKFANLQWNDICKTQLGRRIEDRISL